LLLQAVQLVGLVPPGQVAAHLPPAPVPGTHQLQPVAAPQVAQLVLFRHASAGQAVRAVEPPAPQLAVPPIAWHEMPAVDEQARQTVALKFEGPFRARQFPQLVCAGQTVCGLLAQLPDGVL